MCSLRISLFGSFRVEGDREYKLTYTIQALLAYLLLYRNRTHPREVLASLFWGDYPQERARNCLNTAVWRLRRLLEPEGVPPGMYLLSNLQGELGFNATSDCWLDVAVFEGQARRTITQPLERISSEDIAALDQAVQLYTGELLEGHYNDWALFERERLRCCYINCLNYLMQYSSLHGEYERSLELGNQILGLDPLREEVHRMMMRLYMKNGQRALAARQYELCRKSLHAELGIEPMTETQALYQGIMQNEPSAQPGPTADPAGLQQVLEELHTALYRFDQAQQELYRAARAVEQLVK